jgi:hypothetical protein
LAIACEKCNQKKSNMTAVEFGYPELMDKAKAPLKDAAAVNASRWSLWRTLTAEGYKVACGSGGRTKFNRTNQKYPKAHWIDAACVGTSGAQVRLTPAMSPLVIKATGCSSRLFCQRRDKWGFRLKTKSGELAKPRQRARVHNGFQTGDIVRIVKRTGNDRGAHVGRAVMQASGRGQIARWRKDQDTGKRKYWPINFHARDVVRLLQHADGYGYSFGESTVSEQAMIAQTS